MGLHQGKPWETHLCRTGRESWVDLVHPDVPDPGPSLPVHLGAWNKRDGGLGATRAVEAVQVDLESCQPRY